MKGDIRQEQTPEIKRVTESYLKDRTLIICLREDLDHHNEKGIRELADRYLERGEAKNIIFDFSDVSFMDSSGIGVLMGRYKKAGFCGGKVALAGLSDHIRKILKFSGVNQMIASYREVDDALDALAGGRG